MTQHTAHDYSAATPTELSTALHRGVMNSAQAFFEKDNFIFLEIDEKAVEN